MIKKVREFEWPRVLDEFRPTRRRDGCASCAKRVNLASKRARVENDMKPLLITFFSLTWCQQTMTLDQP